MTRCKFIVKYSIFKKLVVLLPIFAADTKINFVYNFVAPLSQKFPVFVGCLAERICIFHQSVRFPKVNFEPSPNFNYYLVSVTRSECSVGIESITFPYQAKRLKQLHATGLFLYPLKTSENLWFSDIFRGCGKRLVV